MPSFNHHRLHLGNELAGKFFGARRVGRIFRTSDEEERQIWINGTTEFGSWIDILLVSIRMQYDSEAYRSLRQNGIFPCGSKIGVHAWCRIVT